MTEFGTWYKLLKARDVSNLTFEEWLLVTQELELEAFATDVTDFATDGARANWWTQMLLAAHAEVTEMGDELGYKSWDSKRGWMNREAVISEAADALHFIALILASVGATGVDLTDAYMAKVKKNYERQSGDGDDVQARRCPGCGRSLDDTGILRYTEGDETKYCCQACRHPLESEVASA